MQIPYRITVHIQAGIDSLFLSASVYQYKKLDNQ